MQDIQGLIDIIINDIANDIINTPDEEILKEVEEEFGDPAYYANKGRAMINRCWEAIKKKK